METKVTLSPEEILKKKFTRDVKGYDAYEVDSFLDEVMLDYKSYAAAVDSLARENDELRNRIDALNRDKEGMNEALGRVREEKHSLEVKNASLENRLGGIKPGDAPTAENLQLLKRLRILEDFLYQHGYNPNEIVAGAKRQ